MPQPRKKSGAKELPSHGALLGGRLSRLPPSMEHITLAVTPGGGNDTHARPMPRPAPSRARQAQNCAPCAAARERQEAARTATAAGSWVPGALRGVLDPYRGAPLTLPPLPRGAPKPRRSARQTLGICPPCPVMSLRSLSQSRRARKCDASPPRPRCVRPTRQVMPSKRSPRSNPTRSCGAGGKRGASAFRRFTSPRLRRA